MSILKDRQREGSTVGTAVRPDAVTDVDELKQLQTMDVEEMECRCTDVILLVHFYVKKIVNGKDVKNDISIPLY